MQILYMHGLFLLQCLCKIVHCSQGCIRIRVIFSDPENYFECPQVFLGFLGKVYFYAVEESVSSYDSSRWFGENHPYFKSNLKKNYFRFFENVKKKTLLP